MVICLTESLPLKQKLVKVEITTQTEHIIQRRKSGGTMFGLCDIQAASESLKMRGRRWELSLWARSSSFGVPGEWMFH